MISAKLYLNISAKITKLGYPVKIRIISNRKSFYYNLKLYAYKEHWDLIKQEPNKKHPDYRYLLKEITRKKYELLNIVEAANKNNYSPQKVLMLLAGGNAEDALDFIDYFTKHIALLNKRGRTGNASYLNVCLTVLKKFIGNNSLSFATMDYTFLKSFRNYLEINGKSNTTIRNYLAALRVIWNEADRDYEFNYRYPFKKGLIPPRGKVKKLAVTIDVIRAIEQLNYPANKRRWHARNYFLFSFYMAGMSLIDIVQLKKEYRVNNRLIFDSRQKVKNKSNPAEINLLIPPPAEAIVNLYKNKTHYLFTALLTDKNTVDAERLYANFGRYINFGLKAIAKDVSKALNIPIQLSMGTTRHTFRTLGVRLGYSNFLLKELMGHRITDVGYIYQDKYPTALRDKAQLSIIKG